MSSIRIGFILVVMGCAEPTAKYQRAGTPVIHERPQNNSYSINSVDRTVSVRFTRVRNDGDEPIHAFMRRMFQSADSAGARRLVLDLRSVSGSDTFLLVPLLKGVIARERFLGRGGLFVIVGRDSFSPLQNVATLLRHYANPVFASAPTGLGSVR